MEGGEGDLEADLDGDLAGDRFWGEDGPEPRSLAMLDCASSRRLVFGDFSVGPFGGDGDGEVVLGKPG